MQNRDTIEPNNEVAEAMRQLQAARGVNEQLRSAPQVQDLAPMSDEEAAADFARTTGMLIDPTTGAVVGKAPEAPKSAADTRREREEALAHAEREELGIGPVTVYKSPEVGQATMPPYSARYTAGDMLNGVDLDARVVVVDGDEYEMSEAEWKAVVLFTNNVMAVALNTRLTARLKAAGIEEAQPAPAPTAQALPAVRGKKRGRGVQR